MYNITPLWQKERNLLQKFVVKNLKINKKEAVNEMTEASNKKTWCNIVS